MTILTRTIPVLPADVPGAGPLGRHVRHDSRSRGFAYQPRNDRTSLKSATHVRRIPVLDQGDLGSCVGNASVGALGTDPHFAALSDLGQLTFDEPMAVDLYSACTAADDFAGTYPPEDTGTDGLTAAKVLVQRGLISAYTHTFSTNDALIALGDTPLITGINWYSSMDAPLSTGEVRITSQAYVRGGHEIEGAEIDTVDSRVWFWQSWGESFGLKGRFWMSFSTWDRLLGEQGDVTVFTPRVLAPTPTPDDPGHDADVAFATALRPWSNTSPWYDTLVGNRKVKAAARAWLKARGL
jgi:hypothetical protein